MRHEGFSHFIGDRTPANDSTPDPRAALADAMIPVSATPNRGAGIVWIDRRHDAHWIAVDDPDWGHLVELFAHASRLADAELRSMIEELVVPRLRAALFETCLRHPPEP